MKKLTLENRKGQKVVGVLELPEGDIRGTCVVQHGWGGNKERPTVQAMKNGFLESGFQTFTFDATNSFGESDGDYEQSSLTLHKEDLEDVVKWAQKQDWFIAPLALTGHSMGADAVVQYAEKYPEEVAHLVPVAPVVSGELSFKAYEKNLPGELEEWKEKKVIEKAGKDGNVKRRHWWQMEERLNHDLLPEAHKVTMPTLFIVGSEDASCPPEHVQILLDALPKGDSQMQLVEGAPHSFYKPGEMEACTNLIKSWLKDR